MKDKPGMAVMIGIGKPKPPAVKRLDMQDEEPPTPMPEEKAEDEMGDQDDGEEARITEDIETVLGMIPEMGKPIQDMFAALARHCRNAKGGEANESETENYPA